MAFSQDELKKLDILDKESSDSRQHFETVAVVLGVKPREYKPKLKDKDGNKILDKDGRERRAEKAVGLMYTMSEYTTCEPVRFVTAKKLPVVRGNLYKVSGRGYGSNGGSKFLDRDVHVANYK